MYILDTDHMTILERGASGSLTLETRLAMIPATEIATTIVNYEEQTRGWLAHAARARTAEATIEAYRLLAEHLELYCGTRLLPYGSREAVIFDHLKRARIRIGTQDLKIAALALANDAVLLSRNLADFHKVPNLRVPDWTI